MQQQQHVTMLFFVKAGLNHATHIRQHNTHPIHIRTYIKQNKIEALTNGSTTAHIVGYNTAVLLSHVT